MLRQAVFARALCGLSLLLLLQTACTGNGAAPATPQPLRNERLHALMIGELDQELARLDALAFDLHLTPAELDDVRERRARAITLNAARLRASAAEILQLQPDLALGATDGPRFAALAQQLQDSAAALEQQAGSGQLQQLGSTMRTLSATCNACHALYRDR